MQLCGFEIGLNQPLFLMAGPCVIESEQFALDTAGRLKEITTELGILLSTNPVTTRPTAVLDSRSVV